MPYVKVKGYVKTGGKPGRRKAADAFPVEIKTDEPVKSDNFCAEVEAPKKKYHTFKCYMNHMTITKEPMEFIMCSSCGAKATPLIYEQSAPCFCNHAFVRHEGQDVSSAGHCLECGNIKYSADKTRWICNKFVAIQ